MGNIRQFIFPGAILGSLILASFGYSVMARAPIAPIKDNYNSPASQEAQSANKIGSENIGDEAARSKSNGENKVECQVNKNFPESILNWCEKITRHSKKNNLDPDLVAALIWQESGGNPTAYSKSGAVGLMQIMPCDGIAANFQCTNGPCFVNRPSISELQKPNFNIKYGTTMLASLQQKYGDMREALKYYGPMDVGYYYADKVLGIFNVYSD
jgi:soluble lytic murein transglycosylase-like protein